MPAIPRVHLPGPLAPGVITLPPEAARRLASVLRLSSGDAFLAFCGDGKEYLATVEQASAKRLMATLGPVSRQEAPAALSVELYAGLVRANRFDLVVEKTTEAGADVITPLISERAARGDAPSASRYERWERLAAEAAEQSGRLYLPVLQPPVTLERLLDRPGQSILLPHPGEMPWAEAANLLPGRGTLAIVIGPEGGFSDEEVASARQRGAIVASIGPNVFRTETAAIVTTSLVRASGLH